MFCPDAHRDLEKSRELWKLRIRLKLASSKKRVTQSFENDEANGCVFLVLVALSWRGFSASEFLLLLTLVTIRSSSSPLLFECITGATGRSPVPPHLSLSPLEAGYELLEGVPSSEDYVHLRISAGLSPKSVAAAAAGLPNTIFGVIVKKGGRVIGMGRVIGDGGLFFQVVDIAIDPGHQGRGLGKAVVGALVTHLKQTAPTGAYVSLMADGEAQRLYAQYGFRHTAPASVGMALTIP